MERITLPVPETQLVVAVVVQAVAPCTVFVFGYRNATMVGGSFLLPEAAPKTAQHHFDLLIFSRGYYANGASNLAATIADKSGKEITARVLLHKVTDLGTKQASQQWFFDQVLRHGQRLHLDTTAPPYLLHAMPARDVVADTAYWHKCVAVAQFNLQAAADSAHHDVTLCKIALLHTVATQVALGLLRVFMGYTPNAFGLKYLLELCGHFTALPSQLFCPSSPEACKRYKMLCAPPTMLLHWSRLDASESDFDWLLGACQEFLQLATELVAPELQRLETTLTKTILS